jgi:Putative adhesin
MTTFDTPDPIAVDLEVGVGDVRIEASDRVDTTVEVRPSDSAKPADVRAAEQTRVEYANGHLTVKGPSGWRQWVSHRGDSIDVAISVPAGSRLQAEVGVAALRATGRLGECRAKVGVGDVSLEEVGALNLKTGAGDVTVDRVAGRAEVVTGSGGVRIGRIEGTAWVKNSNGDTWIGEAGGDARASTASGTITIDRAGAGVVAKSAHGRVHLGEVAHGTAVAESALGDLEIGVRDGVPAWLDLRTKFGRVRNELDASERPASGEDSVEVHAHTSMGDIMIHRSLAGIDAA